MKNIGDVLSKPLLEQRDLLARGEVLSLDLTQAYIARIEEINPQLNIVIRKNFSRALKRAAELDRARATGQPLGALHGVPFTIKDSFRVHGSPTSYGVPGVRWIPGMGNCTIAERLISAGGIRMGQTNVPLACFDWQTNSPIYGLTKSPLHPDYTVGGSSGGSAASVAAGLSPFEIGSDIAGSIRYPAHCCGVFGLRPTHGFVPFSDTGPALSEKPFHNMAVAGPLARNLTDLKQVFSLITASQDSAKHKPRLRIAYTFGWSGVSADSNTKRLMDSFLARARSQHDVVEIAAPDLMDRAEQLWGLIVGFEFRKLLPLPMRGRPALKLLFKHLIANRIGEGPLPEWFGKGLQLSAEGYREALAEAESLRPRFDSSLTDYDLWLTPVSPGPAIRHQKIGSDLDLDGTKVSYSRYLGTFLTGTATLYHPILTAPIGVNPEGLPVGLQFHGKRGQDWQLLADSGLLLGIS